MSKTKAYCPGSISLIFKKCINDDVALTGSVGIGFTVNYGITAAVEKSETNEIYFNSGKISFPTVANTISLLTKHKVKVQLTSPLPLGCGFGLSGGGSLSTAYAINSLFRIGKTGSELALIAHTAEINNHTGLGTVGTQIKGGFLVKTAPGLPVQAIRIDFTGQKIQAIVIDKLMTSEILKSKKTIEKVNQAADKILKLLSQQSNIAFNRYLDLSFEFSRQAGLIRNQKVQSILRQIRSNGGHAAMAILGNVVLTTSQTVDFGYPTYPLTIVNDKIKLL